MMNENDVIKGLKCLSDEVISCANCAYFKRYRLSACRRQAAIDALDLIESKDAEIERYKNLYEDLKAENLETIKAINKCKAEAIREFVNLFYDECLEDALIDGDLTILVNRRDFENLVREMTEEENDA